jgi:IS4 transposase
MFPAAWLRKIAQECGAAQRKGKVDMAHLFWTLVLGFGIGGDKRTLAGLRRAYQRTTGVELEESSFYYRFSEGLVRMLKRACEHGFSQMAGSARSLAGPLAPFRDLLVADATVIRLKDLLAKRFPGCRTNHSKAALKLHAVLSVTGTGENSIKVTSERRHENRILVAGPWMRGTLLLFDLGYYDFALFSRINKQGGYFLSRLKSNANPLITAVHSTHRGRAIDLIGKRLKEVLPRLQRDVLDVEVEITFSRRIYAGRVRRSHMRLRMVGIKDPHTGEYHFYLTNIPTEKLAAEDIQATYAARWQVELLFKELKGTYRIDDMPSANRNVVEALLYAAILTFIASRRLLEVVRTKLKHMAERLRDQRWARLLASIAHDLLFILTRPPRHCRHVIPGVVAMLLHEAPDPNTTRLPLIKSIEMRQHQYRRRAA